MKAYQEIRLNKFTPYPFYKIIRHFLNLIVYLQILKHFPKTMYIVYLTKTIYDLKKDKKKYTVYCTRGKRTIPLTKGQKGYL